MVVRLRRELDGSGGGRDESGLNGRENWGSGSRSVIQWFSGLGFQLSSKGS
jgi:hypothetical protein